MSDINDQVAINCDGIRVRKDKKNQRGGNYGGADCVSVVNINEFKDDDELRAWLGEGKNTYILATTVVLVKDTHGGVCQYDSDEWLAFVARIVTGKLEHIGIV